MFKPIRILRIIARLNVGGPAIQAISLSGGLPSERYHTMLVCGRVGANEGNMAYMAREKGVEPFMLPELGREISIFDDVRSFFSLRRVIKRFRPHIVHTHTAKAGTLGRLAVLSVNMTVPPEKRIKTVHTFHGHVFHSYFGDLKSSFFILIERFLARFTNRIIVISPLQKRDICHKFKIASEERVRVIPLGFDLSNFKDCRKYRRNMRERFLPRESPDVFLVGAIGRLTAVKNYSMLLEALKILKTRDEKGGHYKFLFVGDGELKRQLIKQASDLGVQDSVIFAGWQKEMPPVYGAIDAVALTSKNEGTPVVVIEAMASGKPVVATDVGGVRDLLGEILETSPGGFHLARNGILVPPGNCEALAEALVFLLQEREVCERMAGESKDFVWKRYSLERLLDDIQMLYSGLVSNQTS